MKTFKTIAAKTIAAVFTAFGLASIVYSSELVKVDDQYYKYTLQEFTSLELPLVADQATRLIFPFVLDNSGFKPTLTYTVKPQEVFGVTEGSSVKGQNVFILENSQSPQDVSALFDAKFNYKPVIGQFFLSVAGYNLSIKLVTSAKPAEQIPNIIFEIPEEDRKHLIDMEINRYKEQLTKEFNEKVDQLDERAKTFAIEYVAGVIDSKPKSKKIRLNQMNDDKSLSVYFDRIMTYDDSYYALNFEITNDGSDDIYINGISHSALNKDVAQPVEGYTSCQGKLERGKTEHCLFVTENPALLRAKEVQTGISTDSGEEVFVW